MQTIKKVIVHIILLALVFWWLPFSFSHHTEQEKSTDFIVEHTKDAHVAHFGGVNLYLPVILYQKGKGISLFSSRRLFNKQGHPSMYKDFKLENGRIVAMSGANVYDFSITKNVFFMFLSLVILLCLLLLFAWHYCRPTNKKVQGAAILLLALVKFIREDVARKNIGEKHYHRFTPYLLTIFCYILLNNLLGLLPGAGNVTGNISVVFVLAVGTFLMTNMNGSRYYWRHIFNPPGVPKFLFPILVPLEVLGLFIRPFTLMLRLFVNMLSGHLLLTTVIGLIFIFNNIAMAGIAIPFGVFILLLKIFVSFVQAYIFTLLSAIAMKNAVQQHEK
ncbi:MAG: F0F1 ATP synthase subunit A [Bacteroidota bacterium]